MDWTEFMALVMKARSTFYMALFKKYDLNSDGEIDQSEIDKILAKMNERRNTTMAKDIRERFDSMLINFWLIPTSPPE